MRRLKKKSNEKLSFFESVTVHFEKKSTNEFQSHNLFYFERFHFPVNNVLQTSCVESTVTPEEHLQNKIPLQCPFNEILM